METNGATVEAPVTAAASDHVITVSKAAVVVETEAVVVVVAVEIETILQEEVTIAMEIPMVSIKTIQFKLFIHEIFKFNCFFCSWKFQQLL